MLREYKNVLDLRPLPAPQNFGRQSFYNWLSFILLK